jgi:hypothetical protein
MRKGSAIPVGSLRDEVHSIVPDSQATEQTTR